VNLAAYDALIAKLEARAEHSPRLYVLQVVALALLGFAVAGLLLLLGIGLLVAAVVGCIVALKGLRLWIALGIAGALLTWNVLKALWVRLEAPPGIEVDAASAPRLRQEVDAIRLAVGAPPIDRILIDGQINAAVCQIPRLGVFGWHRNILILGLPLLRAFPLEEVRAILAHEIGHLLRGHNRFGAWIYRVRATWARLHESLGTRGGGRFAGKFLDLYAPWFNACSFVLARRQEREADAASVRVSGADASGRALRRVAVLARRAERRFWPPFWRRPAAEPEAPAGYLDALHQALVAADPDADRWHHEALLTPTDRNDTHPGLRDRLRAMGIAEIPVEAPPPAQGSASAELLGPLEAGLARKIDAVWRAETERPWKERHEACKGMAARRAELEKLPRPDADQRFELARLLEELEGPGAALAAAAALAEAHPSHAAGRYLVGRLLLANDDAAGVAHIEKAMELDGDAVRPGADLLRDWHHRQGRGTAVRSIERRAEARAEIEAKAAEERNRLPKPKALRKAVFSEAERAAILEVCRRFPDLGELHVAEVAVEHLPEKRHFLVVVRSAASWWSFRKSDADTKLMGGLAADIVLPGTSLLILAKGEQAALAKKAIQATGRAAVYSRAP
jgi:Zn-dependent protease with chaperone function